MAYAIAFVNYKGGSGKTTSCLNVAGWLAKHKKRVLVVDLDPQCNATTGLGIELSSVEYPSWHLFFGRKDIREILLETPSGVHLIPSSTDLIAAETYIADRYYLLKNKLKIIQQNYDYILIDAPPGATALMVNAVIAAKNIIVPLDAGVFAYETLETLRILIMDITRTFKTEVNIMFVLLRKDPTDSIFSNYTKKVSNSVKKYLASCCTVAPTVFIVPYSRKIQDAQANGLPISHYAPESNVGEAYRKLAREIIRYCETD